MRTPTVLDRARQLVDADTAYKTGEISGIGYYHALQGHMDDQNVIAMARALIDAHEEIARLKINRGES